MYKFLYFQKRQFNLQKHTHSSDACHIHICRCTLEIQSKIPHDTLSNHLDITAKESSSTKESNFLCYYGLKFSKHFWTFWGIMVNSPSGSRTFWPQWWRHHYGSKCPNSSSSDRASYHRRFKIPTASLRESQILNFCTAFLWICINSCFHK